jgi:hypothetical protein
MGRNSKLTDAQWDKIGKRLLAGESTSALAREFGISKASVSARFSGRNKTVKDAAHTIVAAENALSKLTFPEQRAARTMADDLLAISNHLAGAGRYGAATAHRLSAIAHGRAELIPDTGPLKQEEKDEIQAVAVLTKLANDASQIGIDLIRANKESFEEARKKEAEQKARAQEAATGEAEDPALAYQKMITSA